MSDSLDKIYNTATEKINYVLDNFSDIEILNATTLKPVDLKSSRAVNGESEKSIRDQLLMFYFANKLGDIHETKWTSI